MRFPWVGGCLGGLEGPFWRFFLGGGGVFLGVDPFEVQGAERLCRISSLCRLVEKLCPNLRCGGDGLLRDVVGFCMHTAVSMIGLEKPKPYPKKSPKNPKKKPKKPKQPPRLNPTTLQP